VIYLLRHGTAEDGASKDDADRELTDAGRRQSEAAGEAMRALGWGIEACLTSPKVRARDTALLACASLGVEPEETDDLRGGPVDLLGLSAGRGDVLLVGHEPDLSNAIAQVTGGQVKLRKGGLAAVDGRLLKLLLGPDELAAIAAGSPGGTDR
jgi:phosphohistidine phosphatase